MKIVTKLAFASLLALSAAAPAFAAEDAESLALAERNVYTHRNGVEVRAQQVKQNVRAYRATDAFAHAPATDGDFYGARDFGIGSER